MITSAGFNALLDMVEMWFVARAMNELSSEASYCH